MSSEALGPRLSRAVVLSAQLTVVGLLVGLACWPLNLIDHWQDQLLLLLPNYRGDRGNWIQMLMATSPVLVMPLLLWLQSDPWREGGGSGIPHTLISLEDPERAPALMNRGALLQRLMSWSIASLALFPLGREGPVVQVGAAVVFHLRRRWPRLVERLSLSNLMAVAAGAGLAAGFNTPLMGVIFVAEELTGSFAPGIIWPALAVCAIAAELSNLGGQPLFSLGVVEAGLIESSQLLWGAVMGVICGLAGGLFAWLLIRTTRWLGPRVRQQPWRWGVLLGGLLAALALLSGGASGGDGEALMAWLLSDPNAHQGSLTILVARLIGPCLALGAGIPGGLIDPAFAIGAVLGDLVGRFYDQSVFGVTFGMAAGLAGATQLPAMSLVFALRMAGDQQLLPGLLMAAVVGSYVGRLWLSKPVYHMLSDLMQKRD